MEDTTVRASCSESRIRASGCWPPFVIMLVYASVTCSVDEFMTLRCYYGLFFITLLYLKVLIHYFTT